MAKRFYTSMNVDIHSSFNTNPYNDMWHKKDIRLSIKAKTLVYYPSRTVQNRNILQAPRKQEAGE